MFDDDGNLEVNNFGRNASTWIDGMKLIGGLGLSVKRQMGWYRHNWMEAAGGFVCWTLSGRDVALKTELVFVLVLRILIASEIIAKTDLVNLIHHEIK